ALLVSFRKAFENHNACDWTELIIVDNNSKDDTARVLEGELHKSDYAFARTVFEPSPGYGAAIKTGLRAARGEFLAWTHADLQTDPADVFRAFREAEKNVSDGFIIKGKRVGRPFSQALFSSGMAVIASVILRKPLWEINAQPKLFRRRLLETVLNGPDDFSLDVYLLYRAKQSGYPINSIDVVFEKRLHGTSKWAFSFSSKVKTTIRTVRYLWALRKTLAVSQLDSTLSK
ncbi:MAG: hypothetical protein A2122_03130, partial [Candidatus Liptonbacteria bacterium GWB1_49_6]